MGTEALVALVLVVTQVAKSWLQKWLPKLDWKAYMTIILSFLASYGVVYYNIAKNDLTFEIWSFVTLGFTVFALANGGKKLLNSVATKIGNNNT